MTPESMRLIRQSWSQVSSRRDLAAVIFYGRLFELDPGLLPLFEHTDFLQQRTKLMSMLDLLVSIADQPDRLIRQAALLGRSHAGYELGGREFEVMGEALLWTLDRMLGLNFTPEMRTAWGELYALVSSVMRRAAGRISAAAVEVPHLPPDTEPDTFPG